MLRSYWILQADPNIGGGLSPDLIGERRNYWADANPDIAMGDIVYLWSQRAESVYAWGEVVEQPSKIRNQELGREQYDLLVVIRTVMSRVDAIRPLHVAQKVEAANQPTLTNSPPGWTPVELTTEEILDINSLIRNQGHQPPPDPGDGWHTAASAGRMLSPCSSLTSDRRMPNIDRFRHLPTGQCCMSISRDGSAMLPG